MHSAPKTPLTAQDYFDFDRKPEARFEFYRGEVFAMAGATVRHNEISLNLATGLMSRVRGHRCRVLMADVRLEVEGDGHYTYPDVFVTCDPRDRGDAVTLRHAKLVVEVLSKDTESYDRGMKADQYRKMPSLEMLILVDSDRLTVEVQRRVDAELWSLQVLRRPEEVLALPFDGLTIPLSEIFATQE